MANTLSIGDVRLLREALKIAASRKRSEARFIAKRRVAPSPAERDCDVKADAMEELRGRLSREMAR